MSTSHFDRDSLLAQAAALINKPNYTKEDRSRADSLLQLADSISPEGNRLRRAKLAAHELDMGIRSSENSGASFVEQEFREYLAHGEINRLSDKTRMEMGGAIHQSRSQGVGSGSIGGYIAPQSFINVLESSLVATDPIFAVATLFETKTGVAFTHPEVDDQAAAATIVAENNTSAAGPDIATVAGISWGTTPTWRSGLIKASVEIAQDSRFDLASVIAKAAGVRIGRGVGQTFVSTLLSGAVSGVTAASATAVTGDELINLMSSVDSAYAQNGSWMMRFATYAAILKLKGSTSGDYLFPASTNSGGRPTLLGFPVYLSPAMPAMTTGRKSISFGDHSRFYRRQVQNSLVVNVYSERYAEYGQIAYETMLRVDGALMKAPDLSTSPAVSQSPLKYITQA
jgi:HK97 family phage major capsid protein